MYKRDLPSHSHSEQLKHYLESQEQPKVYGYVIPTGSMLKTTIFQCLRFVIARDHYII